MSTPSCVGSLSAFYLFAGFITLELCQGCNFITNTRQMRSSVIGVSVDVSSTNDWFALPLSVDISVAEDNSSLQMLFTAECNAKVEVIDFDIKGVSGIQRITTLSPISEPMYVRIKVDGDEAYPSPAILTSSPAKACHGFFAVKNVKAGGHRVTVEIKTNGGGINNMALVVWGGGAN